MKTPLIFTALLFCVFSINAADNKIPNVKTITLESDDSHTVHCSNETQGTISQEETNICVFSQDNNKNRCDDEETWTVTDAAQYICQ